MILPIVKYGDPILRQSCDYIPKITPDIVYIANDMIETLHDVGGIGLSAPQIGKSLQLFVIDIKKEQLKDTDTFVQDGHPIDITSLMPMIFINPEIVNVSEETSSYKEGCLSFPDIYGDVKRPSTITIFYQNHVGDGHRITCDGLLSTCIQHEFDHCQGVLFVDKCRMQKKDRELNKLAIRNIKRATKGKMNLPIVKYGDPVLKQKGERIDNITPDIKQFAMDMIETHASV